MFETMTCQLVAVIIIRSSQKTSVGCATKETATHMLEIKSSDCKVVSYVAPADKQQQVVTVQINIAEGTHCMLSRLSNVYKMSLAKWAFVYTCTTVHACGANL